MAEARDCFYTAPQHRNLFGTLMDEDFDEKAKKAEERMIAENQKEENNALIWWWGGLTLCALLSPGFNNGAILFVGTLGAGAAFISGIMLIVSRRWLHLVLGVIVFIGIGYLADHSWHHSSDDNYSEND